LSLPESLRNKNSEAQVIAVGKGLRNIEGKFTPPSVLVGDSILLRDNHNGDVITVNGEELLLIREDNILARIERGEKPKTNITDLPDIRNLPLE